VVDLLARYWFWLKRSYKIVNYLWLLNYFLPYIKI